MTKINWPVVILNTIGFNMLWGVDPKVMAGVAILLIAHQFGSH